MEKVPWDAFRRDLQVGDGDDAGWLVGMRLSLGVGWGCEAEGTVRQGTYATRVC